MTVYAAMPIEATVEGWVELFGTFDIFGTGKDIRGFVGVFAVKSIDREFCERGGLGILDSCRFDLAQANLVCTDGQEPHAKEDYSKFQSG